MAAGEPTPGASVVELARGLDTALIEQTADPAAIAQITDHRSTPRNTGAQLHTLAGEPDILARFAAELVSVGVAGERRAAQLIYLVVVSRFLPRIVSLAVKGPSAGGKSFLVETVLKYFPASACYALTAMSPLALAYDPEPLQHRMLVIYEASGMAGEMQSYLIRSLLSEGKVRYSTVEKTKAGLQSKLIEREGPTGLIVTTTAVLLHPENETRLLSITVSDSPIQTRAVFHALADGTSREGDVGTWHELQEWLAEGPTDVEVPYAQALAEAIPPVAVRLRRDFSTLLSLIRAHALLHRATRETAEGVVIATMADYAAVRELVSDLVSDAVERTVPESVRETVERVADLTLAGGETSVVKVAAALRLERSAAQRRVTVCIERGYVKNLQEQKGLPSRLALGDPLPQEGAILPTVAELEVVQLCNEIGGGIYPRTPTVVPASPAPDLPTEDERDPLPEEASILAQSIAPGLSGWDPANPICTALRADGVVCGKRMIAVPGGRRPYVCTSPAHNPEYVVMGLANGWLT